VLVSSRSPGLSPRAGTLQRIATSYQALTAVIIESGPELPQHFRGPLEDAAVRRMLVQVLAANVTLHPFVCADPVHVFPSELILPTYVESQ
jgi:hypothetical protein